MNHIEKLQTLNDNKLKEYSNFHKIPYKIIKAIVKNSKIQISNYIDIKQYNKPKIAILISGAFFQNEHKKLNQEFVGHIKPGYNYKYIIQIIRNQYEKYYNVDYYVCGDHKIDESIFDNKLKKSIYFKNDEIELLPNIKNINKLKHKRYSYQFFKKKKIFELINNPSQYEFFIYTRCDWIIILHGYGMLNREVTMHGLKPLPLINKKYYEDIPIRFENIDKNKLYTFHSCYRNNQHIIHDSFAISNYDNMKIYCNAFNYMEEYGTLGLHKYLFKKKMNIDYIDSIIVSNKIDNYYHLPTHCGYSNIPSKEELEKSVNNLKLKYSL